jgi:hypothetical protein
MRSRFRQTQGRPGLPFGAAFLRFLISSRIYWLGANKKPTFQLRVKCSRLSKA